MIISDTVSKPRAPFKPNDTESLLNQEQQKQLRNTLASFATGVTVVTALNPEGSPLGVTVNSFASVSLDPPLVLWSQVNTAPSHSGFLKAKTIVINVLSAEQRRLAAQFSRPDVDKFAGISYSLAQCGTPVLEDCAATFICEIIDHYYGGDHTIHLCKINSFQGHAPHPLIYCRGTYIESDA
ncbi:MAG: flavin reductase family protein [Advenella sp.]|uniref:Flavin reductase like domain-containing protein n=1 Tax=Advenella kashmirensis TaxID=310575 RepID=A0A356LB18_9BURK|nr:flavin reductase family protein [Advenella sp. FME57]HBP28009.1 hypothetical protein [Advenella kashmirensis]